MFIFLPEGYAVCDKNAEYPSTILMRKTQADDNIILPKDCYL